MPLLFKSSKRKRAIFFTWFIASLNSISGSEEIRYLKFFKISFLFFPFTASIKGNPNFL